MIIIIKQNEINTLNSDKIFALQNALNSEQNNILKLKKENKKLIENENGGFYDDN